VAISAAGSILATGGTPGWQLTEPLGYAVSWLKSTMTVCSLHQCGHAYTNVAWLHVNCRVEFQSKFYEGDGRLFEPFYFKTILQQARAAE